MREIGRNLNRLVRDLKAQESPEAMIYLRLLGNELGYLKTNELEKMAYSAGLMIDNVLKMFPTDVCIKYGKKQHYHIRYTFMLTHQVKNYISMIKNVNSIYYPKSEMYMFHS